jgi:hypothetical protein
MKNKNKNNDKQKKEIIDLTRFINPNEAKFDPQGSWTGVPENIYEEPIQDADDL